MEKQTFFYCRGCRNACRLTVTMVDETVTQVTGGGCRRSESVAKKYLEYPKPEGSVEFVCKGCRNACPLEVTMLHGRVITVTGGGCRRSELNAKKYLET